MCSKNEICVLKHKCGRMTCSTKCVGCKFLKTCDKFVEIKCNVNKRFPFICLNCKYLNVCKKDHYSYSPEKAQTASSIIRKESREGINMTEDEYYNFDKILLDGNKKGQSFYHIHKSNSLNRSLKTIYNYSHQGKISVRPIDLPRSVVLKKRKPKISDEYEYLENKNIDRTGHLFSDWLAYQARKRIISYWQMDFLGAPHKSEQMILSMIIPQFQFVYLAVFDKPKQEDILNFFNKLDMRLGERFDSLFEAILTDRDPRFNCFKDIEVRQDGTIRTRIFFCNPGASNEKPFVENLNQQIRTIFPKGLILSGITQSLCDEISSNLNSRYLNSVEGATPSELFIKHYGETIFRKLNLKIIQPNDVKILKYNKY